MRLKPKQRVSVFCFIRLRFRFRLMMMCIHSDPVPKALMAYAPFELRGQVPRIYQVVGMCPEIQEAPSPVGSTLGIEHRLGL